MSRSGASGTIQHANTHISAGVDEINGDQLDIDYTPTNYTITTNGLAPSTQHLTAHLAGIDALLATFVSGTSYAFAYDTTVQTITTANSFQNVTFSNNGQLNGWTHTAGSADFVADATGLHYVVITGTVEKNGGANPTAAIRVTINGVEVPGSQFGMDLTSNNTAFVVTRNLMVQVTAAETVRIQFAATTTTTFITPGPNPGTATSPPSITLTMQRVT